MSAADEGRSLGELVKTAVDELSGLVHDEIALAKAELRRDVRKALLGSAALVIGAALLLLAMPLFSFGLAFWLRNWWDLPLAVACAIVGGLYVVLGGLLFGFAKAKFGRVSPPERSIRSAKESAAVLSAVKPHPRGVPADKAGSAT
ncbi:phage holin family protein [Streptomyces sp. NPDC049881]|uniref:phage holin family protein n=1 Tax=unclassified Streptomyces TaxID=2593676 RepID=UPI00344726DC